MPLKFGDFVFDTESRQLLQDGTAVHLSPKAFRLLEVLIERRPGVVRKETLLQEVWDGQIVEEENVKNLIAEIRHALGNQGAVIRTAHRIGYAFDGEAFEIRRPHDVRWFIHDGTMSWPVAGSVLIGRSPECDILLYSSSVSRVHARITVDNSTIVIEDLGSRNGTTVGGRRIDSPTALHDSDVILIGSVTLTLFSDARLPVTIPV